MNKSQRLNLFDLITNIIVIALVGAGAYCGYAYPLKAAGKTFFELNPQALIYLPIIATCVILIGALLMIWSNIVSIIKKRDCTPRFFLSIAFIGAVLGLVNTIMTFVVGNGFYAQAKFDFALIFNYQGGMLFFLFLIPVVSALQFIFFKAEPTINFKKTFSPFIAIILYNIVIVSLVLASEPKVAVANYVPAFFYCVTPALAAEFELAYGITVNTTHAIIILVASIVGTYVVSVLVWGLNRIMSLIIVGAEYRTGKRAEPKEKKGGFKNYVKEKFSFAGTGARLDHVYHISYHDRKKHTWKVKSEGAGRALKVFPTQKEAIEYAKNEVRKHGGSIRIHSMVGKMRKDVNWIN